MATTISNDGFWSEIDIDNFMETKEAPSVYEDAQIKDALKIAMVHANVDLEDLKTALKDKGVTIFADYSEADGDDGNIIDEMPILDFFYNLAVYSYAKYQLLRLAPALGWSVREEDAAKNDNDMSILLLERYNYAINQLFKRCIKISNLTTLDDFSSSVSLI